MNNNNEKIEKIIETILQLLEEGRSTSDILNLLPEHQSEVKEIIKIIDNLSIEKEKFVPSRELLSRLLLQITEVTKDKESRYLFEEREKLKGRPSLITIIKNQFAMATNWKIIVPLGVLVIVIAVIVITQFGGRPQVVGPTAPTIKSPVAPVTQPPVATGNIDDIVNTLFTDSSDEISQTLEAMDNDVALLGFESQAISDFGQSYNENDF